MRNLDTVDWVFSQIRIFDLIAISNTEKSCFDSKLAMFRMTYQSLQLSMVHDVKIQNVHEFRWLSVSGFKIGF